MLHLDIPEMEYYDQNTGIFTYVKSQTLQLEHSLVSLSKWESKWEKPFLDDNKKTDEETLDYIRCMTITQNVNPDVYKTLPKESIDKIIEYINADMTATWIIDMGKKSGKKDKEIITSELIYYWMIALNIPFECQKWHLNRLITLVKVCNAKNTPPEKMSKKDIMERNRRINEERRNKLKSKG